MPRPPLAYFLPLTTGCLLATSCMALSSAQPTEGAHELGFNPAKDATALAAGYRDADANGEQDWGGQNWGGQTRGGGEPTDASRPTDVPLADDRRGLGSEADLRITPKLIRTGTLSVVVPTFAPFRSDLDTWLADTGGYIADASLSHHEGAVGWASLSLRVPSEDFDALVSWTEERVQVESVQVNTADVTEAWVDVAARIDNGKREEARLQELLDDATGTLADVLAVERELSRVRGEVEGAEGRMRVLSDQVSMSTLQLDVRVQDPYQAYVATTFGQDASDVFTGSVGAMGKAARGLALLAVGASPWLAMMAGLILGLITVLRRVRRTPAVAG